MLEHDGQLDWGQSLFKGDFSVVEALFVLSLGGHQD
jgi:hypothetical protein